MAEEDVLKEADDASTDAATDKTQQTDGGADKAAADADKTSDATKDDKGGEKPRDEKGKFVPHAAMHEERERRKAAEAEARKSREIIERMEARFNDFIESSKPKPQAPDPEKDPKAYWEHKLGETTDAVKQIGEKLTKTEEEQAKAREYETFARRVMDKEAEFAAKTPDYHQAASYWREQRLAELELEGFGEEAEQIMQNEILAVTARALKQGRNPAEVWYEKAKKRGYAAQAPKKTEAEEAVETIKKGKDAATSLSTASGTATNKLSLKAIADMSDEEYAALRQKMSPREIAALSER